jgi:hypothetical protein
MKARPDSSAYLSSSVTLSKALRIDSGKGAFMGGCLQRMAASAGVAPV